MRVLPSSFLFLSMLALGSQAPAQEAETWSLHGQATVVVQGHGAFVSPYAGPNSLESRKEVRTSFTSTLFLGRRLWEGGELYVNPEAAALELVWDAWAFRGGSFLEPEVANGLLFDHQVARAHGDVVEVEHGHEIGGRPGRVRLMGFANHARMGSYREALALDPSAPDITATRRAGRTKYGWGLSAEQALTGDLGAFLRAGWNDGRTETWAFTEVDRTAAGGLSLAGPRWGRPEDRLGLAAIVNGLSPDHRAYLAAGGTGFILGDGRLNAGQERIVEAYYAFEAAHGFTVSLDAERVQNPAFNRDRGPVSIFALPVQGHF